MTPQPEPEFILRVAGFNRFKDLAQLRIVFLLGTGKDSIIRAVLGSRLDSLSENECGLFRFPNAWGANQWVLVFVARDSSKLIEGLNAYAQRLRRTVTEFVLDQMTRATYLSGRDEELSGQIAESFGFSLDVPKKWLLQDKFGTENFIYLYSHFPDRSIFVFWSDTVASLNPDSVLTVRDHLTGRYYDGDSADRSAVTADTIQFLGVPCLRLRGVWQNKKQVLGGPFVLYAFVYQTRFFILDGTVFNPGEKKLSNLFQVEAIIRTFVPVSH
jgi:hypothetical protein